MNKVNYVNIASRETATFQRIVIGPYEFFAWIPFEYGHPFVSSLDDVQCCLTPKRRPETQDMETACEYDLMIEELGQEGVLTAQELIEALERMQIRLPEDEPKELPRGPHEDDDNAGAGAAPVC
jgi:hypothetical protein